MTDERAFQFLATTNPGLESVACEEVREITGAVADREYRGTVGFTAGESAVYALNRWARSLHRVLVVLVDDSVDGPDDVYDRTREADPAAYLDPAAPFAVRSTRHGHHGFSSVDVADRAGQAVVDDVRAATGERIPVDLDDPAQVLRAFVRNDRYLLAVDTTGEASLHRRPYRVCEHNAPLRPTIAYSLVRLAGFEPGDSLVDPMCGSATIPTEAALAALGRPPTPDREYAHERLPFLADDSRDASPPEDDPGALAAPDDNPGDFRGIDRRDRWVRCGRVNVAAAGLEAVVDVESGDATGATLDADVVVSNLPYGVRTHGDLKRLYREFSANLRSGTWRRAVLLTTSPEFLALPVERRIDVRYGRLDATVVVADR